MRLKELAPRIIVFLLVFSLFNFMKEARLALKRSLNSSLKEVINSQNQERNLDKRTKVSFRNEEVLFSSRNSALVG